MRASKLRLYSHLQITSHRLKKAADKAMGEACSLSTAQVGVLAFIQSRGTVKQNEIAESFSLNESAVTALTMKLRQKDILIRKRSTEDARAWQLSLTDKGRHFLKRASDPFQHYNRKLEQALGEDGVEELSRLLDELDKAFY